jgi:hypothetical protein
MDKLYLLKDPSVAKWLKWVLPLLVGRVSKPLWWASFLSLNELIRHQLMKLRMNIDNLKTDDPQITRNISKVSNAITCWFLYKATGSNRNFPKDYALLYIWLTYYGGLNPPSAKHIVISPKYSPYLKLDTYKSKTLHKLYENKEFIIFPMIFGQILSNYLTPTKYKLNQRYLSSSIKLRILNPIWINYSLGVKSHSMNWPGLLKSYLSHNLMIAGFVGLSALKTRLVDRYYEVKHGINTSASVSQVVKSYLMYVFHRSSSFTNFIYGPNLISILLISLTSRFVSLKSSSYGHNNKLLFKNYIKVIGFIAAYATLYANSINLIRDFGYTSSSDKESGSISESPRRISKTFLNGLNLYMFRLICLSKWRIIKENHPYFRWFKLHTWNKIEALVMCFGVYKIMNLRDFIHRDENLLDKACQELEKNSLIKMVEKIM